MLAPLLINISHFRNLLYAALLSTVPQSVCAVTVTSQVDPLAPYLTNSLFSHSPITLLSLPSHSPKCTSPNKAHLYAALLSKVPQSHCIVTGATQQQVALSIEQQAADVVSVTLSPAEMGNGIPEAGAA